MAQHPSYNNCCVIKIKNFLSTWWVSRVLSAQILAADSAEESEVYDSITDDFVVKKYALKVNVHLLLKWIMGEISLHETPSHNRKDHLEKIIFLIETEEDLIHMIALTDELRSIMKEMSTKPELKKYLQKKEYFSEEDPYWPSRWVINVEWHFKPIPRKMWNLKNVEKLDLSNTGYATRRKEVAHYVGLFRELKHLDLEGNALTSLPSTLQLCKKLEVLKLFNNEFKCLPAFLICMPSLKVLTRQENNFDFSSPCKITRPEENRIRIVIDEDEVETAKQIIFTCKSLRTLSAITLVQHIPLSTVDDYQSLDCPRTLHNTLYDALKDINYCSHCHRGLYSEKNYKYFATLESFNGYYYLPLSGFACSYDCAAKSISRVFDMNLGYKGDKTDDIYVHDIEFDNWVSDHNSKFKKQNRFVRGIRRIRKIFR